MSRSPFPHVWPLALTALLAACDGGKSSTSTGSAGSSAGGTSAQGGSTASGGTAGSAGGSGAVGGSGGAAGGSGGASGGSGGATGGSGGAMALCPPGSDSLVLSLAGAAPSPVAGVPPADGYSPGFAILEGPVWIDGALYLSQISSNGSPPPSRILKLVPGSPAEVLIADAGTNGLAISQDGQLFGAVHKDGSVSRFDLANPAAAPVPVASQFMGARFDSPNDLAIRGDGNIYFSDPDWQSPKPDPQAEERAYRVAPGGAITAFGQFQENGSSQKVQKPNGVTLSIDEKTLYLGGSSGLYEMPVAADGSVAEGTRVAAVNGGVDGMTKDCAGNLYVASGQDVVVLDEKNALIGKISLPLQVTNVAFGGADRKTLFITTLGSDPKLFQVTLNVPGYPY
jgi:gluconolactonase